MWYVMILTSCSEYCLLGLVMHIIALNVFKTLNKGENVTPVTVLLLFTISLISQIKIN